jgi:two-component system response regulator BaeR
MTEKAPLILIVEDDPKIAAVLNDYLTDSGYRTQEIDNGADALDFMRARGADLILLDLMLPRLDGLEVCKEVRKFSAIPIIMLTARIDEVDRLIGLEVGADDYVCKPFSPREVVARVKAQLRRAGFAVQATAKATEITVERTQLRVLIDGNPLPLTPVEFRLLAEMIAHPERVYSRQQLLDLAHEDQRDINDRTIDTHIKNIRRKLNQLLPDADCLQSVYGVGYRFAVPGATL